MIIRMAQVRLFGPADRLEEVVEELQDFGLLHLTAPRPRPQWGLYEPEPVEGRELRRLRALLERVEWCHDRLRPLASRDDRQSGRPPVEPAEAERLARTVRARIRELDARERELGERLSRLTGYLELLEAFRELPTPPPDAAAEVHYLLLEEDGRVVDELRGALSERMGDGFELRTAPLGEAGRIAVALVVSRAAAAPLGRLLTEAGIEELPPPEGYRDAGGDVRPAMRAEERKLARALAGVEGRRVELATAYLGSLRGARACLQDELAEREALGRATRTEGAFMLEGWLPAADVRRLERRLAERFGETVVVERLAREDWAGEAPVALSNPRIFRPFEAITGLFPLPRYGTIDPTPFVAVFFPMFFGVILGDVAYGTILGGAALVLRARSRPGTLLRSIAEIAGACALFSVIFGFLYGELLGDVGRRWFGLHALGMDREEALVPFLLFAIGLGLVHIVLGLVLGAFATLRDEPRRSLGRGITALMVLLVTVALLAAVEVLPGAFFTPVVIALLVAFPVLVIAEGLLAPLELLSTLGNILSYARIMALGTASVMMAVVANRLAGAVGGVLVGVLLALLFHVVNFALGVFGPTIHALRLHYVEFFGKFYSPGGTRYRPFGHWQPDGSERPTAGRGA